MLIENSQFSILISISNTHYTRWIAWMAHLIYLWASSWIWAPGSNGGSTELDPSPRTANSAAANRRTTRKRRSVIASAAYLEMQTEKKNKLEFQMWTPKSWVWVLKRSFEQRMRINITPLGSQIHRPWVSASIGIVFAILNNSLFFSRISKIDCHSIYPALSICASPITYWHTKHGFHIRCVYT